MSIPFVRDFDFDYGRLDRVSPRIRRVVCNNPGPFTFTGTGTYIVGAGEVAVIDPGPLDDAHLAALLAAVEGERVSAILLTHTHADHAPLAGPLAEATGAPILAAPVPDASTRPASADGGEHGDATVAPDCVLADGALVSGPDWTLRTITTPGHASNHLAFWLAEERALFSGDHVMGWSTTVVAPPDGDMADYMASLERTMALDASILWPTHGPPVVHPAPFLAAYREHRLERERQILARLAAGDRAIPDMVAALYPGLDPRVRPAAALSVLAHLIKLAKDGRAVADPAPGLDAVWTAR